MSRREKTENRFRQRLLRATAILVVGTFLPGQMVFAKENLFSSEQISVENEATEDLAAVEQLGNLIAEQWEEDYFSEMIVETGSHQIEIDGENCDIQDEFSLSAREARQVVASEKSIEEYFETEAEGCYETERIGSGKVQVTAPFQTRRLIVTGVIPEDRKGASETVEFPQYDTVILQYDTEEQAQSACEELREKYGEQACQPDRIFSSDEIIKESAGEEQYTCTSWGASLMGMEYLKNQTEYQKDGETIPLSNTITVAVIDTGINKDSCFFEGRTITDSSRWFENEDDIITQQKDVGENSGEKSIGHGTHVAGIIADCTPSNVELMILKVFNKNESTASYLSVFCALEYAVSAEADVINMSLGFSVSEGESDPLLDKVIEEAYKKGIPICAAAGNEGADTSTIYPACNEQVFTVGAIDSQKNRNASSNYGATLDFCAPGVRIESASYDSKEGTAIKTGTSMASPHLAAAAAYVKLMNPEATVSQVENILKSFAVDLGDEGWDAYYGWGYPDISELYGKTESDDTTEPGDITKPDDTTEPGDIIKPDDTTKPGDVTEPDKAVNIGQNISLPSGVTAHTNGVQIVAKVSSFKVKRKGSRAVLLQWKKNKNASGYQIQYARKKSFAEKKNDYIKKSGKTQYVLKKMKRGQTYYFRIRAYKTVNGKKIYSVWSTKKKIKIK